MGAITTTEQRVEILEQEIDDARRRLQKLERYVEAVSHVMIDITAYRTIS